jgi:acyl-CoA reductase-like NAD-dependent aldehyde dehydrogenase
MTTTLTSEVTTYRWSSTDEADRFTVEDPATGEAIAVIQGGGPDQVSAAVEAANRAFDTDSRWRTAAERAAFLLRAADVFEEHADELALLESQENGIVRRLSSPSPQHAGARHGHPRTEQGSRPRLLPHRLCR